jgi:hypothetical protein
MAVDPVDASKLSDRELLLILHERVGTLGRDVHDLRDGLTAKIAALEAKVEHLQEVKADKLAVDGDLEKQAQLNELRTKQINSINQRLAFCAGVLAILNIVVPVLMRYGFPR